jgi:hypothetical protein
MNPAYTYRNKHGVFYFRRVLSDRNTFNRIDLRFSLRTRAASEAKIRAYRAWLTADSMISNGCMDMDRIRAEIQSTVLMDETYKVSRPTTISYGPELVRLSDIVKSYDINLLQDVIGQVQDTGGEIFAPFASRDCSLYAIHDDEYKDGKRQVNEGLA